MGLLLSALAATRSIRYRSERRRAEGQAMVDQQQPGTPKSDYPASVEHAHRRQPAYFTGCLLGGAVGDALGSPVEFSSLDEIRRRFGHSGLRELVSSYG